MSEAGAKTKKLIAHKVLIPLVAAGASAAAGYAARKAPEFLEAKVLPTLRQAGDGAGKTAQKVPERARSAASNTGHVAEDLTDRARAIVGRGGSRAAGSGGARREPLSQNELEHRRKERAEHRAGRRSATS